MYTDDDLYREHLKQRAAEADTTILPGMYVRWKPEYKPEKADWHVGQADLINYSNGWAEVLVYDDASRELRTVHVALKALQENQQFCLECNQVTETGVDCWDNCAECPTPCSQACSDCGTHKEAEQ